VGSGIRPIVNFFIYSSIIISFAATSLTLETYIFLDQPINYKYLAFVFFSTLLTYSIHRIVGIKKLNKKFIEDRFKVILIFKTHITVYAVIAFFATLFFLTRLPFSLLIYLIIPAIISGLYTIPLLSNNKRLRDYDYIKIILIALTWAAVTTIGILESKNISIPLFILLFIYLEKFIYIFGITLPFDIRDESIDKYSNVKTFPAIWGRDKTYLIIKLLHILCFIITTFLYSYIYTFNVLVLIVLGFIYYLSYMAVYISKNKTSDIYYSGLLDSMIILKSLFTIGVISYTT